MGTRFNRNDANVPDDRLFAADFITDQNAQDIDLLQIVKDFGCLPCLGTGLEVTEKNASEHKIQISGGWAYGNDGHRILVETAQEAVLIAWDGTTNYIKIVYASTTDTTRPAHRSGVSYPTRKNDSFTITVSTDTPTGNDIVLASVKQNGTDPMSISVEERIVRTCKLVPQSSVPAVAAQEGTGTGAEPPPPGQQNILPDLPKGRTIPMPIILSGTRNGEAWDGIETVMPEELGRTTAAVNLLTLERVNLKSGTPLADVKVWIGDWGTGQRDSTNLKKCNFSGLTKSGALWNDNLWILGPNDTPPGPGFYYLVKHDESWYSKIVDAGNNGTSNWVICDDELPDAVAADYYVCPYAEKYRVEAIPYETDTVLRAADFKGTVFVPRRTSPAAPLVVVQNLNLGGKYKLQAASMITGDNFTKYAEADFVVGSDLLVCWEPETEEIAVTPVDGGVEVVIPAHTSGKAEPEAYEVCYTYGSDSTSDPATPDFSNSEHPTIRSKERKLKLDIPPGRKANVKVRAVRSRMIMRCGGFDKILSLAGTRAGGVSLRRNRKTFSNHFKETSLAASATKTVDIQKLPNPIWPESISIFNPTDASEAKFEVYVHGSNQAYDAGRKIQIGTGGKASTIDARGWVEEAISDFRITDPAMKVTLKNIDTNPQTLELNYTVQYREDSDSELN